MSETKPSVSNGGKPTPDQIRQLQIQKLIKSGKAFEFPSTSEEILKRFSNQPPSLNFHIYETHFRFNNSQGSNIIPKNSPMIKEFLHHILREEIPMEMSELIKDFAIKSYDGCLILQIYDHRNMIDTGSVGSTTTSAETSEDSSEDKPKLTKPKTYRSILKPTQLSLYYDLLFHTDSALTRFTDQLALQMEAEILTLTNRKLDLTVPLNPYLQEEYLHPPIEYPKKVYNENEDEYELVFLHRSEQQRPVRKLHQEEMFLHKSSDYEEIMFLLSDKYKRTDERDRKLMVIDNFTSSNSTSNIDSSDVATPLSPVSRSTTVGPDSKPKKDVSAISSTNVSTAGQFMRLRFIEDIRKRKEAQKAQKDATVAMAGSNGVNTIYQNNSINGTSPEKLMSDPSGIQRSQTPGSQSVATSTTSLNPQALRAQQLQQHQLRLQQQKQQAQAPNQPAPSQRHTQLPQPETSFNPNFNQQSQPMARRMSPQVSQLPYSPQPYQSPQMTNSQPNNMGNNVRNPRMQQLQQQMPLNGQNQQFLNQPQNPTSTGSASDQQGSSNRPQSVQNQSMRQLMQQQQQHIFQTTLNAQEQQLFKQLQGKMSALINMGNTGITPNKTRLSQQQQQQALQQAKIFQQQMFQKFPTYFQKLKQVQLLAQQRRVQLQQQQQQQQQQLQLPQQFSPDMMSSGGLKRTYRKN